MIYEEGMKRLNESLKITRTRNGRSDAIDHEIVKNVFIPTYGQKAFRAWCHSGTRDANGKTFEDNGKQGDVRFNFYSRMYKCIMPWMIKALDLRNDLPDSPEERIKWNNKMIDLLEANLNLGEFMLLLGKENFYYQVKIGGFRTNDENGDKSDYKSSTIGTFNTRDRAGIFKEFQKDYEIISQEINAFYLSGGG